MLKECASGLEMDFDIFSKKRSNNFSERPHRRARIFHDGQCNAISTSLMPLLIFSSVQRNSDSQCVRQIPQNCPFPLGILAPSYTLFVGPPESPTQTASRSVQLCLQSCWRDQQTDTQRYHVRYSVCSN